MKLPWARIRAEVLKRETRQQAHLLTWRAAWPALPPPTRASPAPTSRHTTIRSANSPCCLKKKARICRGKAFIRSPRVSRSRKNLSSACDLGTLRLPGTLRQRTQSQKDPQGRDRQAATHGKFSRAADAPLADNLGLAFLTQIDPEGGWSKLLAGLQGNPPVARILEDLAYENPGRSI